MIPLLRKPGFARSTIYPKIWDKKWLNEEYIEKKKTIQEIADETGCFWYAVKNALVRLGIERRRYTMSKAAYQVRKEAKKDWKRKARK